MDDLALARRLSRKAEEAAQPPTYPTLQEQLLGVIQYAGLDVTEEVRRLVGELEKAALEAREGEGDRSDLPACSDPLN